MSRHAKESKTNYSKRITKLFTPSKFLAGHAIIICAECYSQLRAVLFSEEKEQEGMHYTVTQKARFDRHMKLC